MNGNNVVLVDIFARDGRDKTKIKFIQLDNFEPEIHTIVLKKVAATDNSELKVLVIDPNNSNYSNHLVDNGFLFSINLEDKNIPISFLAPEYNSKEPIQIYISGKDLRDCIDISAKIAAGIIKYTKDNDDDLNTPEAIKGHELIKMLSNNDKIDGNFLKSAPAVKIKQSSDFEEVKLFYKIEKIIKSGKDFINAIKGPIASQDIDAGYKDILKEERNGEDILENLKDFCNNSLSEEILGCLCFSEETENFD